MCVKNVVCEMAVILFQPQWVKEHKFTKRVCHFWPGCISLFCWPSSIQFASLHPGHLFPSMGNGPHSDYHISTDHILYCWPSISIAVNTTLSLEQNIAALQSRYPWMNCIPIYAGIVTYVVSIFVFIKQNIIKNKC